MGSHAPSSAADAEQSRRVMDAIRRIVQTLRVFDRAAEKGLGLSGAQVFVLQKLRDGGAVSVNELAERTHTHQSSVSVVVQKLVRQGLLTRRRSEEDARRMQISITPRGKSKLRSAPQAAQERLIGAVRRLSPESRKSLVAALEQLVSDMGVDRQRPVFFFEEDSSNRPTRRRRRNDDDV